jgi:hypothetical protein
VDGEVTDTENGGESSAAEGTTTGNGLILVQGEGQALTKEVGDGLLDSGDTSAATNHLNVVNVLNLELGLSESLLDGDGNAVQQRANHILHLLTLDHSANIGVLHQGLDAHGGLGVGGQDLLEFLGGSQGTRPGLGVSADIDLVLLLELLGEVLSEGIVEVTTTKVTVIGGGLDVQLTLAELNNGGSVIGVTDIDEGDTAGLLLGAGQVELGDTVTQSGGSGVVDEAEGIETGNVSRIDHRTALNVGEPGGNADSDVGHGQTELLGGGVLDLGQEHGDQLSRGELLLLAEVVDLNTGEAIDIADGGCVVALLEFDIGVVERAADQAFEGTDSVLEVGSLLCLCGFTDVSAASVETDERPIGQEISS